MALVYLLLVLLPVAAIAYLVWDHKRKTAERNAVSAGRLHELLTTAPAEYPAEADAPAAPLAAAAPASLASSVPPAASAALFDAPPAAALYAVRKRVLSAPQTLLYYLLRTGLPDHVVLARVTLASLLDAAPGLAGFAREEQIRRLAALTVDFVVVDKNMQPVAVIELAAVDAGGAAQADRASARSRLAAAGVRYIELEPTALPRKDALRALVLDATIDGETKRAAPEGIVSQGG